MKIIMAHFAVLVSIFALGFPAAAQVPPVINHQGVITIKEGGTPFSGTGTFKFGIVDASGAYVWTNDGSEVGAPADNAPANPVKLEVKAGLYSLGLGDTALENMVEIPDGIFPGDGLRLRIYFDDGSSGEQRLVPDRPLTSVPYAMFATGAMKADAATTAETAASAERADEADRALSADRAVEADRAIVADRAVEADRADEAEHADEADRATVAQTSRGLFAGGVIASMTGSGATSLIMSPLDVMSEGQESPLRVEATFEKGFTADFTPGNGNGGREPGIAIETEDFVRVFAIGSSTDPGKVDYLLSTRSNPVLPDGFDVRRWLGSRLWDNNLGQFVRFRSVFRGRDRKCVYMTPRFVLDNQTASNFTDLDVSRHVPATAAEFELMAIATRNVNDETGAPLRIYVRPYPVPAEVSQIPGDAWLFATGPGDEMMGAGSVAVEAQTEDGPVRFQFAVSPPGTQVDFYVRSFTESL